MRIEVTEQDIEVGKRGNGDLCMVAIALQRQTGRQWTVGTYEATMETGRRYCDRVHVPLPEEVEDRIERFDLGQDVEPFAFQFECEEHLREQEEELPVAA